MKRSTVRVLVVDDYEPWRRFVCLTLRIHPKLQVISEVGDGLEAVAQAQQLQPDLILLDLGLPTLNGIGAARRIHELTPKAKILFLSENRSLDIAEEALRTGAVGYVVKADAANDLLLAVETVLQGKRFVSPSLAIHDLTDSLDPQGSPPHRDNVVEFIPTQKVEIPRHHEVGFYSDDRRFLDHLTQFIASALRAGNAAIVVATEAHRDSLIQRLLAQGLDVGAAIEEGRYISLDAAETLSTFMVNDLPDPARFLEAAGYLITAAAKAVEGEHPLVAICGECDPPLWVLGKGEAMIQLEQLWNEIVRKYDVNILCGYSLGGIQHRMDDQLFQRICAEHSAVHSQ